MEGDKSYRRSLNLLIEIAKKTGLNSESIFTTTELSRQLGISQQSVSRKLVVLEKGGYIQRRSSTSGILIRLNRIAVDELRQSYTELRFLFSPQKRCRMNGVVESGLGEGRFYTELPGYKRQFIERLGISPFPGTLNLHVDEDEKESFVQCRQPIDIPGFKTKDRTFGRIRAYPAVLHRVKVALIVPERTLHRTNTAELISEKYLRRRLKLKDGDRVVLN